jgi:SPP1 family predicted phage head-tail adaptor
MNPGKLDRRLVIQKRVLTKDTTGSRVETWADESKVWAEVVAHRASEAQPANAERPQDTRQFRIRHRTINSTDYRILYQSQFFNITGITEEGGRENSLLVDAIAIKSIS